jgi:branched-chain amino acid transport system substrate-binding protein
MATVPRSAPGTLIGLVAVLGTVGGATARPASVQPLPRSWCSAVQHPSGKLLVASDLPLSGLGRSRAIQAAKAIGFVLARHGWKAGSYSLAYQSCDDATARAGRWDSRRARANARAYAANPSVVGVIGTFNSGATQIELPILNRAPRGPLAMVSPANTLVGLTHRGPATALGEPRRYYPTGKRNYARLVAANDYQGAADAELARQLGLTKVFLLHDSDDYGVGVAAAFGKAARKLGLTVSGFRAWDPSARSYRLLALAIKRSGAQAVFLGGLLCSNGGKLIKDLRAFLPRIQIMASDGFTPLAAVVKQAGAAAEGITVSVAGLPISGLPAAGKAFVKAFSKTIGGKQPNPNSVYAAQAAEVLLQAIARSDGTRAGVTRALLQVRIPDGITGDIAFNASGDLTENPVTIYAVRSGKVAILKIVAPAANLVAGM